MRDPWSMTVAGRREDWPTVRERIDLAQVATELLGPPANRRGRRLYWRCPFHDDHSPSFVVDTGKKRWACYPCGLHGDAAALVMTVNGWTFPEAKAYLSGEAAPARRTTPTPQRPAPTRPPAGAPPAPDAMSAEEAAALVAEAERRLWAPEGAGELDRLHARGLTDATRRAARLGACAPLDLPGRPRGIVFTWFDADRPTLVKLRQPDGIKPKYREIYRDVARLTGIYPGPQIIQTGRPLIVVEGEADALLLGQELAGLAPVVTLGPAFARPEARILGRMLAAFPWFIATDADEAGDKAAHGWPPCARRVRPPGSFKDWTEAVQGRVNLRRWWTERLGGNEAPPLFSWDELARQRWGDACDDPEGGIIVT